MSGFGPCRPLLLDDLGRCAGITFKAGSLIDLSLANLVIAGPRLKGSVVSYDEATGTIRLVPSSQIIVQQNELAGEQPNTQLTGAVRSVQS